jgi:hypothetical protein
MKERPILFSAPMVRALLAGTKTQTRRIVKPQPAPFVQHTPDRHPTTRTAPYIDAYCGEKKTEANPRGMSCDWHWWTADNRCGERVARCPYGQPGDRLWVRETFGYYRPFAGDSTDVPTYRADLDNCGQCPVVLDGEEVLVSPRDNWRPSIHMPRKVSRITLEITSVRVERLQEISEADAKAEGCAASNAVEMNDGSPCYTVPYRDLWTRINGIDNPGSWDANPWVWVVEFKRVTL